METERLIKAIAADGGAPAMPMRSAWMAAAAVATMAAALVFFGSLGPRPDIADAAMTARFLFKFVATIALFVTALLALAALARPGTNMRRVLPMLLVAPGLLLAAVGVELMIIPSNQIGQRWLGSNATVCLTFIPLIGLGPLAAFLLALRHGASPYPTLSGAVAGLVAGGLAATFYAAHCTDNSPLFVATWYPLAITLLAGLGAIAGRFVARW